MAKTLGRCRPFNSSTIKPEDKKHHQELKLSIQKQQFQIQPIYLTKQNEIKVLSDKAKYICHQTWGNNLCLRNKALFSRNQLKWTNSKDQKLGFIQCG